MEYYYVIADFYPDINNASDFEEALIPYHTFEEACDAIESTMDIYDNHNEDNIYDAKSILMILSIDLCEKLKLVLHSDDEDEIRKFNEIAEEYK